MAITFQAGVNNLTLIFGITQYLSPRTDTRLGINRKNNIDSILVYYERYEIIKKEENGYNFIMTIISIYKIIRPSKIFADQKSSYFDQ